MFITKFNGRVINHNCSALQVHFSAVIQRRMQGFVVVLRATVYHQNIQARQTLKEGR